MKTETMFSSQSDNWETPQWLFDQLDAEFGFNLDACADDQNHKCPVYITKDQDGLTYDWGGYCVWCNPPYSEMPMWAKKCYEEGHKPNTTVVMLIPSRTDTRWFQNYILHRAEVRFIKGRLRFSGADNNAPFPTAIVIFRGPEE